MFKPTAISRTLLGAAWLLASLAGQAHESSPLTPAYREECGSCHVPFPSRLLPAAAWRNLMQNLEQHFGSDASLSPAKQQEITHFLEANAGHNDNNALQANKQKQNPRITETAWFKREHRDGHDGLSAEIWRSPAVGKPSNCAACHRQAADGDFRERNIRLPRLTPGSTR